MDLTESNGSGTPIYIAVVSFLLLVIAAVVANWGIIVPGSQGGTNLAGIYRGEAGYFDPPKHSQCPKRYVFLAKIESNVITSNHEMMSFVAPMSADGELDIRRNHLLPVSDVSISVTGPITDATLYNGNCGQGYFRLTKQ